MDIPRHTPTSTNETRIPTSNHFFAGDLCDDEQHDASAHNTDSHDAQDLVTLAPRVLIDMGGIRDSEVEPEDK